MADETPPLTPEQQQDLDDAQERVGAFLGAAKVAAFNGWTVGFFAAVSILLGVFSVTNLVVGVGLAVVARNELVGRTRLRRFDPSGLELLWRNQLGFMVLIILYCLWSIYRTVAFPVPGMAQLTELLGDGTGELVQWLLLTAYAAAIVATTLFQGLNARYYFVRVARLRDYLRDTPQWVVDLQRPIGIE